MTRYALDNDDYQSSRSPSIISSPDLSLTGSYQTNGLGGDQFSLTTGQLISRGGLAHRSVAFLVSVFRYGASLT